mmetsp:Transcript_5245/g.5702  ORF Transcript_5245/g.5702 Transcript_5245/m.5702 type:complete len:134 (-) Transcript_5245:127-528(-)
MEDKLKESDKYKNDLLRDQQAVTDKLFAEAVAPDNMRNDSFFKYAIQRPPLFLGIGLALTAFGWSTSLFFRGLPASTPTILWMRASGITLVLGSSFIYSVIESDEYKREVKIALDERDRLRAIEKQKTQTTRL